MQTAPRSRKNFRKRARAREAPVDQDQELEELHVRDKLALLREAQRLKQSERRINLVPGVHQDIQQVSAGQDEDSVLPGLKASFKIEKANEEVEKQMEQYIDERLPSKKDPNLSEPQPKGDSIFAIPQHLQIKPRPAYDPGEGLPNAGLEEVELGIDAERKNIQDTETARRVLMDDKNRIARELAELRRIKAAEANQSDQVKVLVPGNISSNFQRHQDNFIRQLNENETQAHRSRPAPGSATDNIVAKRFKDRFARK